jgi:hypothetical protein
MNDDLLVAARRFGNAPRVLDLDDLGIALFLEGFAMPMLWFGTYVPLRHRRLMPDLLIEFRTWISKLLPDETNPDWHTLATWASTALEGPRQQEFLDTIGRSFYQRWQIRKREMARANIVSAVALACAVVAHIISLLGMVFATWWLFPYWLSVLILTNLICRFNLHWKPKRPAESV